jgi:hypothetical protein
MLRKINLVVLLVMLCCVSATAMSAGLPGTTDTVFNRKFVAKLKPMMSYDQIVKLIGIEGKKTGEDKKSPLPKMYYHWNGGRKSALDIKVAGGKVADVTVTAPKGQKYSLGKNGQLVELD